MMERRAFIGGAAALSLVGTSANAAIQCAPHIPNVRACSVGLTNVPTITQNCQQWCWAACAELAFSVQGYDVPQEWFVQKLFGLSGVCAPAVGQQIAQAISGQWTDKNGKTFGAQASPLMDLDFFPPITHPAPLNVVRDELIQDRLVIAGTLGHAIAITAMDYLEDAFGQQQLGQITIRDPWPLSLNKNVMTAQQFYNGRLLMTVQFF